MYTANRTVAPASKGSLTAALMLAFRAYISDIYNARSPMKGTRERERKIKLTQRVYKEFASSYVHIYSKALVLSLFTYFFFVFFYSTSGITQTGRERETEMKVVR